MVRVTNRRKQSLNILETQLDAVTLEPVEIGNCLRIRHGLPMWKAALQWATRAGIPDSVEPTSRQAQTSDRPAPGRRPADRP